MNPRHAARHALLAFVVVSLGYWGFSARQIVSAGTDAAADASASRTDRKVIAYYFHGKARCQSCLSIERYTGEAIKEGFPRELKSGLLEFDSVNVQEPANNHFIDDYQLSSWGLILAEFRDGRRTRWKNLDKVWELVMGDPSGFHGYVRKEVAAFLAVEG